MKLRLLGAADLEQALPLPLAIETAKRAYAGLSAGDSVMPQRLAIPVAAAGTTLVKPALTAAGLGAKLVSVFPGNRERGLAVTAGLMVLLDPQTGHPLGLCDGTSLTALRTAAAVAAATELLAPPAARRAALFGCGGQAGSIALALDSVRRLESLQVYARTRSSLEAFVERLRPRLRARVVAAAGPDAALEGAQVIVAATSSPTPVFDGARLEAGAHVNAIGSFTAEMREVDVETVRRSRVFVDSRAAAQAEAGELLAAQRAGITAPEAWTELGAVIAGRAPGRQSDTEITLFKSVGLAVQDVEAASAALERAARLDLGTLVEL